MYEVWDVVRDRVWYRFASRDDAEWMVRHLTTCGYLVRLG